MPDQNYLFADLPLQAVLENRMGRAVLAAEEHPEHALLAMGAGEATADLVSRFRLEAPTLVEGAISVSPPEEVDVDVARVRDRDPNAIDRPYVRGIAVTYYVPFVGDPECFRARPSNITVNPPRGAVVDQELHFRYERADHDVGATKGSFDADLAAVRQALCSMTSEVHPFNGALPARIMQSVDERLIRLQRSRAGVEQLGYPVRATARPAPATQVQVERPAAAARPEEERYDVALSFAGEDGHYVEQVANLLRAVGVKVFYSEFEQTTLWGKDLAAYLGEIYEKRARYVVMFISKHYVSKGWPTLERRHAQARALLSSEEYILPARFDDSEVPGLPSTIGFVDLKKTSPEQLVAMIRDKLHR